MITKLGIIRQYIPVTISCSILLAIWQLVFSTHSYIFQIIWHQFGWKSPIPNWEFISSPINIIQAAPSEIANGSIITDSILTFTHTSIAFVIALVISVILALSLSISKPLYRALEPILKGMSGIPPVTLLPILVLAMGLESSSIIALGVFGASLSISLILIKVISSISVSLTKMLQNIGYSTTGAWLWKFMSVSDSLYIASREGLRWALILVTVAEMQIGDVSRGIGYYINTARLNQTYESLYLGVIACGIVSLLLQSSLSLLARVVYLLTKTLLLRLGFRQAFNQFINH
jgi:NitT/TauT family transport system permease protein